MSNTPAKVVHKFRTKYIRVMELIMFFKCTKLNSKKQTNSCARRSNNSLPADKAGDKVAHFMLRVVGWWGGGAHELTLHKLFLSVRESLPAECTGAALK